MITNFLDHLDIVRPTLLVDKKRALANISAMVSKAKNNGVRLRPHFKTHQSAEIGEWLRTQGVDAITVSSLQMARYFAQNGWRDITVAIPVNLREISLINELAAQIALHVVVESIETLFFLEERLQAPVQLWLKIDVGYHRAGVDFADRNALHQLAQAIRQCRRLEFRGILTHAGHTYNARSKEEIVKIYRESVARLQDARMTLNTHLDSAIEISVGDTPSCTVVDDLSDVDEIRPGNFVFYDVMQYAHGVCQAKQIAVAVACPVLAIHPSRNKILIYGGAVHFSKESIAWPTVGQIYGLVVPAGSTTWGQPIPGAFLASISQEHGIVKAEQEFVRQIHPGELLLILPVHSCLTVDLLGEYLSVDGKRFGSLSTRVSCLN